MRSDRWRLATRLRAAVGFELCLLKRAPESRLGAPGALNAYDSSASCPSGRRPGSERDLCVRGEKRVEVRTRDTRVEGYWEMRGGATRDVNRLALELLVCEFDVT